MTDLAEVVHCDVIAAIENWARWCNRTAECYPDCPTNWDLIDQVEYKNCHMTTEEKLELAREHKEPDELAAMRIERIIAHTLDRPKQVAVRIHYIVMPEHQRHDLGLTIEQWNERRARFATRRGNWYFSPAMYLEAVDKAIDAIAGAL